MSRAARSVFFFSIYVISLGVFLVVAPNILLKFFNIPETSEVWIRVVGMMVLLIGFYYFQAATNEEGLTKFFRWTIYARSTVIIFFSIFVLLNFIKPTLILFGVFDLAGAIWTTLALRSTSK